MKKLLLLASCFSLTLLSPALAQEESVQGGGSAIVAVVNDDVLSSLDVQYRLMMILGTTGISDTPETRARLIPQVISSLLDERLQLQEAARNGVSVTEDEVAQAVKSIEAQRGLPEGSMMAKMESLGIPRPVFLDQVKAQLVWTKLILKKIRPNVKISDDEVERERAKAKPENGAQEVLIELLPLTVDKPENEAAVKALAQKLAAEIRGGAPFESVARELKTSASDASSIKPFWVGVEMLDPAIAGVIAKAERGEISEPVRTPEGYTIVHLVDRRSAAVAGTTSTLTEVVMKDILLRLKNDAQKTDVSVVMDIGREVAKNPGTCSDPGVAGVKSLSDLDISVAFRRDTLDHLPEALRSIVEKLPVGGVSEPYATQEGIRLFMLCEKLEKPSALADAEETRQLLYRQKMELEAQKYLRQLRRDATVDMRISRAAR